MVQFLSINFFSWISSIFVGFFKSSRFFVSLCRGLVPRKQTENVCDTLIFFLRKKGEFGIRVDFFNRNGCIDCSNSKHT